MPYSAKDADEPEYADPDGLFEVWCDPEISPPQRHYSIYTVAPMFSIKEDGEQLTGAYYASMHRCPPDETFRL